MTVHAIVPASVVAFIGTDVTDAWTPTPGGPTHVALTIPVEGYPEDIQALVGFILSGEHHCQIDLHGMAGLAPTLLRVGLGRRLEEWAAQHGKEVNPGSLKPVDPVVAERYGYNLN